MTQVAAWRGTIGCDGGPVLVANASDFAHWRGSDPLPASEREELHVWGSFTSELPERFRPAGPPGHQFIPAPDPRALEALRDELLAYVRQRWPDATATYAFETWVVRRPDGGRLQIQLDPTSEYDRCIRHLEQVGLHRYDGDRTCLVWSVGPGLVEVVRQPTGRVVLVQVEYADDDEQAEAAVQRALEESGHGSVATGLWLAITRGPTVVAWAPNSETEWKGRSRTSEPLPSEPGVLLDLSTDQSGALFAVPPGRYGVMTGARQDDEVGVAWCALVPERVEGA